MCQLGSLTAWMRNSCSLTAWRLTSLALRQVQLGSLTAWQRGFVVWLLGRVNNCRAGNPKTCNHHWTRHQLYIISFRKSGSTPLERSGLGVWTQRTGAWSKRYVLSRSHIYIYIYNLYLQYWDNTNTINIIQYIYIYIYKYYLYTCCISSAFKCISKHIPSVTSDSSLIVSCSLFRVFNRGSYQRICVLKNLVDDIWMPGHPKSQKARISPSDHGELRKCEQHVNFSVKKTIHTIHQ